MSQSAPALSAFLARWQSAGGAERANAQLFITELCDLLGLPHPTPALADTSKNNYVFEHTIAVTNPDGTTSTNFIDLYKRHHFVLETKQGIEKQDAQRDPTAPAGPAARTPKRLKKGHGTRGTKMWDDALLRAKTQAENYVRNIPDDNPPFLLVVDVGYQFETYADFSGLGKTYTPFPDNLSHRFKLTDLADPKRGPDLLERLKKIWTDPQSLNPAKRSAKVTREIAAKLAELSKSLEKSGHHPESVAHFLMRVLFTLFAEDVHLIPNNAFTRLLEDLKDTPDKFAPMAMAVWQNMDKGGFSPVLREDLLRFNGGLFADTQALKLTGNQLELLIDAAHQDWSDVEPAIFGTLLERALDPTERHKLGAHYTPRAYVERLVLPTVIEPLREQWQIAKNAAIAQANHGELKKAIKTVAEFLKTLCNTTVLDPACGSGNFLYVTLEHMKRLEGEVHDFLAQFPNTQLPLEYTGLTVDPHNLRGIEINPRAAAITDLVLWIGYLQWHFRTHGKTMPAEPVLKKFDNIECSDAVLAYDKKELARDDHGKPISRWDGVTFKHHLVTGEDIPNEKAQRETYIYVSPRKSEWTNKTGEYPDFIVGNPPFIGGWMIRQALGDGYVDALWSTYSDMPEKADFVMYWWERAAELVRTGKVRQFGFITTNSITQVFQQRILSKHLDAPRQPLSLTFAIPDHPWVDAAGAAAVRVAMTVGTAQSKASKSSRLGEVSDETGGEDAIKIDIAEVALINANLTAGPRTDKVTALLANDGVCSPGVQLYGAGFILSPSEVEGWHKTSDWKKLREVVFRYMNGRDFMGDTRGAFVIDFFGIEVDDARKKYPIAYQRVLERVKPERDQNRREAVKEKWWRFGWERPVWRAAVHGLNRFISTPETSKHRVFAFLDESVRPDNMLTNIALDDSYFLGVLSSRIHVMWALQVGARLEDRPRYTKTTCFDPFPFPDCTAKQKSRIRQIAEELDAHRKRQQAKFPDLTLTDMYNVLEKLRAADQSAAGALTGGSSAAATRVSASPSVPQSLSASVPSPPTIHSAAFSPKDKQIHDRGLISILKQLHDDLDAAVFDAYGWPIDLTDEQLLEKLVALNHQRAAEEAQGLIKYLRPEFQAGAKDFLRLETIPRLAKAIPDFSYFSLKAIRTDLKEHHIEVETATLPRYLHDFAKEAIIFDAGRSWYSTLATPFVLNREPVEELVDLLNKRFPFLEFAAWSTAQIAPYGHHLLSRFVSFVYTARDAMESVAEALRDSRFEVFLNPSKAERAKNFRIKDKTVVVLPLISEGPAEGKFATIEKILVDLYVESRALNLMDQHEFKRVMANVLRDHRISIGTLIRYAESRRDIEIEDLIGVKIN